MIEFEATVDEVEHDFNPRFEETGNIQHGYGRYAFLKGGRQYVENSISRGYPLEMKLGIALSPVNDDASDHELFQAGKKWRVTIEEVTP